MVSYYNYMYVKKIIKNAWTYLFITFYREYIYFSSQIYFIIIAIISLLIMFCVGSR